MPIKFDRKRKVLHLYNNEISYLFHISPDNKLIHLYFGSYLSDFDLNTMKINTNNYYSYFDGSKEIFKTTDDFNYETSSMEYPCFGLGDYRPCAIKIKGPLGDYNSDFEFVRFKTYKGKRKLKGLPSIRDNKEEFETLEVYLIDKVSKVELVLSYSISSSLPVITRSVKVINKNEEDIHVLNLYSACLDFKTSKYKMYYLSGRYGKERNIRCNKLLSGEQRICSLEGKSSHNFSPFAAICDLNTSEDYGNVYSTTLLYSGNFDLKVKVDQCDTTRLLIGINPETFDYCLESNQEVVSPEAVLLYTNKGLGEMSRIYHKLFMNHLIHPYWKEAKRPLLLNSWEGCYFNFNTEKLIAIIDEAHKLGIEMFVLDDGWFGKRDNDSCSLGDWYVNKDKIDLHKIVDHLHSLNMKFGLWFEPEMICPKSDLYKKHPDYVIAAPGRNMTLMRHQAMLDMSKKEVCDNVYNQMKKMIDEYHIEYIKWDHNRAMTEAFSASLSKEHMGEFAHRFMLGTYSVLERINKNYPHILIESCCAGGGRFDAGMLYYSPQVWTSDETDALERLSIQEGTSFIFPCSSMGAHVSANPRCDYNTKANVAMQGSFGYELDPLRLKDEDKQLIKKQIEKYHKYYNLTHHGDLYRLINHYEDYSQCAWMFVSSDKKEALFTYVVPVKGLDYYQYVKLKGLDESKYYYCEETKKTYLGKFLMEFGINLTFNFIYTGQSISLYFKEVKMK